MLFGDDLDSSLDTFRVGEIEIKDQDLAISTADLLCQEPTAFEEIFIASGDPKQRVEVDCRRLSPGDQKLFDAAKQKEVKAWLDHGTAKNFQKGL